MKIAVLGLAKNESGHVRSWAESAKDADYVILVDSGSTDATRTVFKEMAATKPHWRLHQISVQPWRFDIGRNTALALVPEDVDYVVSLDLDERLLPGWRDAICDVEQIYLERQTSINYLVKGGTRSSNIFKRHGHSWEGPYKPALIYHIPGSRCVRMVDATVIEKVQSNKRLTEIQIQDRLEAISLAVHKDASDCHMAYIHAKALLSVGRELKAVSEFQRFLKMTSVGQPGRVYSMCVLSKVNLDTQRQHDARVYALSAIAEDNMFSPNREPYLRLAQVSYSLEAWDECLYAIKAALAIPEPVDHDEKDPLAYSAYFYDIGFVAACHVRDLNLAAKYIDCALAMHPKDERLLNNKVSLQEFHTW